MIKKFSFLGRKTSFLVLFLLFLAQSAYSQSGTFTVRKSYDNDNETEVTITAACTGGGAFDDNPLEADPNTPAVFTYRGYTGNPICTAVESDGPYGYTADASECESGVPLNGSCTIENTYNTETFTVYKTYEDDNNSAVMVRLTCTDGDITETPLSADPSLNLPAIFEVTGFEGTPTCTAEEDTVTPGYSVENSECLTPTDLGGSCTLGNTLNTGTFTVHKTYNDDNTLPVLIKANCTGNGTFTENPLHAAPGSPAEFEYSGFVGTPSCTALESHVPEGYAGDTLDCQDGDPLGSSCTIDNTLLVRLAGNDRLGDAGIFQYYTANGNWQTFIRILNTSDKVVSMKVRFREAANSREVLDFIVLLSPKDVWTAWTDSDATGKGLPGIRVNDTSCLFPVEGNTLHQGFVMLFPDDPDKVNLLGADFSSAGYTGLYDDYGPDVAKRLAEGHIEIIGIAQHDPASDFGIAVRHNNGQQSGTGQPSNCSEARGLWQLGANGAEGEGLDNVLAMNGYLIQVPLGQGAGFDPDVLADFVSTSGSEGSLWEAASLTATEPDMDSALPNIGPHIPRDKQKGFELVQPVVGGVDAVSYILQRKSVINEWAASLNEDAIVYDYYTQWVVTFPTKHYYVDLQNDADFNITIDDISPTLVDPDDSAVSNDAFEPFNEEFDQGYVNGESCEPFKIDMWNREEMFHSYVSPEGNYPAELCYETNVLVFSDVYTEQGLNSNFATTVPEAVFPVEVGGAKSERGWASVSFYDSEDDNDISASIEERRIIWDLAGLPVTGFMFSIYNTNNKFTNHALVHAHKYKRQSVNAGPPEIISDGGQDDAAVDVVENTTYVTDVESIDYNDVEGFGLTYTLTGGADEAKFEIDEDFGYLTFIVAPDFDIPGDDDADNVYDVQVTVTDSGPGDLLTDVQDIAVTVTDLNEYPDIVSNGGGLAAVPDPIQVGEGTRPVTFVEAIDPDTMPIQTLTFEILDGLDADKFEFAEPTMGLAPAISALRFNFDTDFDIPVDSDGDNIYEVRVKVTDNGTPYLSDTQTFRVEVVDSNENPVITSDGGGDTAAVSVPEGSGMVTKVTATDPDTMPVQCLEFQIIGGADADKFKLGAQDPDPCVADTDSALSQNLRFKASADPDFENPTDADGDNVYEVLVMVKDDGNPVLNDTQLISVTVTDVNDESPIFTSPAAVDHPENSTAKILTITATDLEADCGPPAVDCTGVQTLEFEIFGGTDNARFELLNPVGSSPYSVDLHFKAPPPDFEALEDSNNDNKFRVKVRVTDVGDPGPAPLVTEQTITVTLTDVNENPEITSGGGGDTAAYVRPENQAGITVLTATDVEVDCGAPAVDCTGEQTLIWSITGGADADKFGINPGTKDLYFNLIPFQGAGNQAPNFENPLDDDNDNVYHVQVTVTDNGLPEPQNLTDVQDITVTVTDVNETPEITSDGGGSSANLLIRENTTSVTTVKAKDQDADCGPPTTDGCRGIQELDFTITGGADAAKFQLASPTASSPWSAGLEFIDAPDFENPQDLAAPAGDNTYEVDVTVTDRGAPLADGLSDVQTIRVTVTNRNDFAPHIVAPEKDYASPDIAEIELVEGAEFVTKVHAIDFDTPDQELTYLKANGGVGGPDGALFSLDPTTGELSFIAPAVLGGDDDGDSVFEVFVIARDGDVPASHDSEPLAIFVTIVAACTDATDGDGDRLPDCVETNDGVFHGVNQTGTDPANPDTDGDAIDDGDEVLGTLAGLDLPALGVSPVRKNILLEHDWFDESLDCASHTHQPTVTAIGLVAAAFDSAPVSNPDGTYGITLIQDYGQGGAFTGGNLIMDPDGVLIGGVNDAEFLAHKAANFASNREDYFHYVINPHRYDTDSGSSGQAERPGDDLIVSLQCVFDNAGDNQDVANTIMHELGHNLNLRHGGDEDLNYKPNYNSVMNYKYQFPGVDSCDDLDQVGDGILDYSVGDRIVLDEEHLDENFDTCGNPVWDWNGINGIEADISMDINLDGDPQDLPDDIYPDGSLDVLEDHDDWGNFVFTGPLNPDPDGDGEPKSTRSLIMSSSSLIAKEIVSCDNPRPVRVQ